MSQFFGQADLLCDVKEQGGSLNQLFHNKSLDDKSPDVKLTHTQAYSHKKNWMVLPFAVTDADLLLRSTTSLRFSPKGLASNFCPPC